MLSRVVAISVLRRLRLAGMTMACLLGFLILRPVAAESADRPEEPWTLMPFQVATYVHDAESARLLNDLSQFSTQLLIWNDTPRTQAVTVGGIAKTALMLFIREHNSPLRSTPLGADAIVERISSAYQSMQSPRIVRIDVSAKYDIGSVPPVDVVGGKAQVPFIVTNSRSTPIRFRLAAINASNPRQLQTDLTLRPGQTLGFFLTSAIKTSSAPMSLEASVENGPKQVFTLPLRAWETEVVKVKVLDESGKSTPARIYLTGADGRAYAPEKVMHRNVTGDYGQRYAGEFYFYTPGSFEVRMPVGGAELDVVKGMEYRPIHRTVDVKKSSTAALELRLQRLTNLRTAGWYSGDIHLHMNLFYQTRIKPADILLIAKAEDLNVANILACNDPLTDKINDFQYFEGKPNAMSDKTYILSVNQEMRNDLYGHVGFVNLKSFVEPAYSGFPGSRYPYDDSPNYYQAMKAKAQGAVVTYVHPGLTSELPVDVALGAADTLDVMCQGDENVNTRYWYRLLNCGFRIPISAGTDSFLNIPSHLVAGAGRLYVQTGPELTYDRWIDGYRKGRSFATNAPLLTFTVDGHSPGDEIKAERSGTIVKICGQARSILPMVALELVHNGRTIRRVEAGADPTTLELSEEFEIRESGWLGLRVRGEANRLAPNDREIYAHTSPVYISLGNQPVAYKEDALYFVGQIDALLDKLEKTGVFKQPADKEKVIALFRKGQDVYRAIAARAEK